MFTKIFKNLIVLFVLTTLFGCPIRKPDKCEWTGGENSIGRTWTWTFGAAESVNDQFVCGIVLDNTYSISDISFDTNGNLIDTNSDVLIDYENQISTEMSSLGLYDQDTENIYFFQTNEIVSDSILSNAELTISFLDNQVPLVGDSIIIGMTTINDLDNGLNEFSTCTDLIETSATGCCELLGGGCIQSTQTECDLVNGVWDSNKTCNPATGMCEVPTLSQWGIILLSLLLLTICSLSIIRQRQPNLAMATGSMQGMKVPLFNMDLFKRTALKSIPFIILAIAIISLIEGGLFTRNIIGTVLSGLIISYLIHFILINEKLGE